MGVDIYFFYHGFGLKAFEGRHIIIISNVALIQVCISYVCFLIVKYKE